MKQRSKESLKAVVVTLRDRVEFMVMTTRTLQAKPEQRIAGDVGDICQHLRPLSLDVALVVLVDAVAKIHRRDECIAVAGGDLVPRQLFPNELVVRFVRIE